MNAKMRGSVLTKLSASTAYGACPTTTNSRRFVLDDGGKLVGFVANARVVRERDPAAHGDLTEPHVVLAVAGEVIAVSLYREARIAQDAWELEAKIPVGKEDNVQATRSYSTACSISIERRS